MSLSLCYHGCPESGSVNTGVMQKKSRDMFDSCKRTMRSDANQEEYIHSSLHSLIELFRSHKSV